jgi:prolyl-tRNA synthetase
LDRGRKIAINQEVMSDEVTNQLGLDKSALEQVNAAEVGNIFSFGSSKTEQLGLKFTDENGQEKPVILGSYGIGVTRLMGVLAEHFADEHGLVWPEAVAPFKVYLARLGNGQPVIDAADRAYKELTEAGISVLYDDRRDASAGEMLTDADLMGLPLRIVVSDKTVASNTYELRKRRSSNIEQIPADQLVKLLTTV